MYLMLETRTDISFAVGKLSRYCENRQQNNWVSVERIFRYIAGTKDLGLVYHGDASADLVGFSDSDWVGDLGIRKFTDGYIFSTAGSSVGYCSRNQTTVAASSCDAEYIGLSSTCKGSIWLRRLTNDMLLETNSRGPTTIKSDNQGAIALAGRESVNRQKSTFT